MTERSPARRKDKPADLKIPIPLIDAQALVKANRGDLTCPCCQHRLNGEIVFLQGQPGVVLVCTNWAECGFYEY